MLSLRILCRNSVFRSTCLFPQPTLQSRVKDTNSTCLSKCFSTRAIVPSVTSGFKSGGFQGSLILKRQYSDNPPVRPRKRYSLVVKTLKEYGPVFLIFHTCTSVLTIAVFYILVSRYVDYTVSDLLNEYFN